MIICHVARSTNNSFCLTYKIQTNILPSGTKTIQLRNRLYKFHRYKPYNENFMERKWRYNFPTENKCDQLTKVNKSVIIVGERKKENGCFNPSRRRMPCSLLDIVGGVCGAEERTRHKSNQTVSLSSCSKDIVSFKTYLKLLTCSCQN